MEVNMFTAEELKTRLRSFPVVLFLLSDLERARLVSLRNDENSK